MLPLLTNQLCYNKLEVELLKLLKLLYIYIYIYMWQKHIKSLKWTKMKMKTENIK